MIIKETIKVFIPYGILLLWKYFTINILNVFRNKFKYFQVKENTVLIVECHDNHGETLPGYIKYFLDLEYNVDVFISMFKKTGDTKRRNDLGLFNCFLNNDKVKIMPLSAIDMNLFFRSKVITNYSHVLINTFNNEMERNHLFKVDLFKLKPICVVNTPDIYHEYFNTDKVISLVKMDRINKKPFHVVNSHYFGEFSKKNKSQVTTFFVLNTNELFRRNIYLLFDACKNLYSMGISNFSVKIIGKGINIPEYDFNNFQVYGSLDFQSMYNEIYNSDFILALIDQASVQYTNKASGTYQLSYGFLKPILLHKKFSEVSGFTNENSILYNDNDKLAQAMERCIKMTDNDYSSLVSELEISQKKLYINSLNNLKKTLETL